MNKDIIPPHVHVRIGRDEELSASIPDGKRLAGDMPYRKIWKRIHDIIRENSEKFLRAWNMQTNGLKVDINYSLGLVQAIHEDGQDIPLD